MVRAKTQWGYAIDYDREIARDQADIEALTSPLLLAVIAEMTEADAKIMTSGYSYGGHGVLAFVINVPARWQQRAKIFGLTSLEITEMAALAEWSTGISEIDSAESDQGWYQRAEVLFSKWETFTFLSEEERRNRLAKAKASMARHRRNKEKYSAGTAAR